MALLLLLLGVLGSKSNKRYTVTKVVDGDTIHVRSGYAIIKVRLACIDSPELKQPGGLEAKEALTTALGNNRVQLDITSIDQYGRTVAEVYVNNTNVNKAMVFYGQAHFYEQYKDGCLNNVKEYQEASDYARKSKMGLWANDDVVAPWDWRREN